MTKPTTLLRMTAWSLLGLLDLQAYSHNDPLSEPPGTPIKERKFASLEDVPSNDVLPYELGTNEFGKEYVDLNFGVDPITQDHRLTAKAVVDRLDVTQNYIDLVTPNDLVTLPVGVRKEIGNITYTLAISKARFTPDYTEVTAYVRITTPQNNVEGQREHLFFGANNIKLSHQGGIYGDANLVLLGDVPIPINGGNGLVVLRGGFDMATGATAQHTYVTIDCGGFKELGLSADVLFPRTLLEPVGDDYQVIRDPNRKVQGHFNAIVGDWNDILVEVDLPPFQLTKTGSTDGSGKAGLVFDLNTAIFDFSDLRNAPNVVFPPDYQKYLVPGNEELWRGVYVNTLSVVLPKQFKKRRSDRRISFEASHLLIDGMGVSGLFAANHLLPITEGEAAGWQFSVDRFEAAILTNNLVGAGFEGNIVLPVTQEVTPEEAQKGNSPALGRKTLAYQAIIDPVRDEYLLTAALQDTLPFNVFKAKATLLPNSYVELKVSQGKFRPRAVLHGNLALTENKPGPSAEAIPMNVEEIIFENLQLQTVAP